MVLDAGDEFVRVPLGLIALNWLRLYLPLIRESLPQTRRNVGGQGLGFAREGFRTLLSGVSASDLRIGARFTVDRAKVVHAALRDAARTIDQMPSNFMTYPMGGRILPVERGRLRGPPSIVELGTDYLTAFGWMLFESAPTPSPHLRFDVRFWCTSWGPDATGIWREFSPCPLAFAEYLLIGVAAYLFPDDLLNDEAVNRAASPS